LGTTGETPTLTKEEKKQIIELAIETIDGRVPLIVGIGGNNTAEIIETIKESSFEGIDAILSVCPYYNKPSQEGIYQHYKAIAESSPLPVILYNVPGRTSSNINAETALRLAEIPNIIGIKEASGNFHQCMKILREKPEDFMIISGDDELTLPLLGLGVDGVISVIANAYPKEFSDMTRAALRGNFEEARKLHFSLFEAMTLIFAEGSPSGIKALLEIKGIAQNKLRLPLAPVSKELYEKLKKLG
jgi:4-hydroxy-tetrahydrodipicolinate synthase